MMMSLGLYAHFIFNAFPDTKAERAQQISSFVRSWTGAPDVLVLYNYQNTDPEDISNLKFFVRQGVNPVDGCRYYFIVKKASKKVLEFPVKLCYYLGTY